MNFNMPELIKNKKFWIIIASIVGGLIIVGSSCIGCIASISGITTNSEPSSAEENSSEKSDVSDSESEVTKTSNNKVNSSLYSSIAESSTVSTQSSASKPDKSTSSSSVTSRLGESSSSTSSEQQSSSTTSEAPPASSVSTSSSEPVQTVYYVLNTNTYRVHTSSCRHVKEIEPQNYATTTDLQDAKSKGYKACGRCKPF